MLIKKLKKKLKILKILLNVFFFKLKVKKKKMFGGKKFEKNYEFFF